ncbi:MAG: hypothetical protein ACYSU0_08725, partial [Planctomycetota bacterium]
MAPSPDEAFEPAGRDRKAEEEMFANLRRESDERAAAPALGKPERRTSGPASATASGLAVESFTLIDADTDRPVADFDPIP